MSLLHINHRATIRVSVQPVTRQEGVAGAAEPNHREGVVVPVVRAELQVQAAGVPAAPRAVRAEQAVQLVLQPVQAEPEEAAVQVRQEEEREELT